MRTRFWLGLAAVTAIAVGSVLGGLLVHSSELDAFERGQREQALRAAQQADALTSLSVGQLAGAAAFFQTEGDFNRHEFDVMSNSLLEGGLLAATGFIEPVRREERARFERRHGFSIVELDRRGDLQRAGDRPLYFPLTHAATNLPVGSAIPVGYDVGESPVGKSFLLRARDTGKPVATPVMGLPLGAHGVAVFRPVYADDAPADTVAQRRAALVGFASGAFLVSDLAQAATATLPQGVEAQLLERGRSITGPDLPREQSAVATIRIADRMWLLVVRDPDRPGVALPLLMAVLGISLAALLGALVLIWSRNERMQELQLQASQDSLTGLKNRRRFEEDLRTELARSRREAVEGALLMLDLDNFKRVNDTLGHPMGDRVIEEIAAVLKARTRETDVLARLGGDEFAIVLPHCGVEEARGVAEAIAAAIREHVPSEEGVPRITASIGIAMFGPELRTSLESVQVDADTAMYAAKEAGRDAVRVSGYESLAQPQDPSGRGLDGGA